jgi:hypothetical protein
MSLWNWNIRGNGAFLAHAVFPQGVVNNNSHILANICETKTPRGEATIPHFGAAGMEIRNIVPHSDGTVDLWVEVNWDDPLDLRIQFVIF